MTGLTQSQTLMWVGQQLNPDSPLYNTIILFRLEGEIDPDRFSKAHSTVVANCKTMRTVFGSEGGMPCQKTIEASALPSIDVIDLADTSDPLVELRNIIEQRKNVVLDINKCLFDSVLFRVSDTLSFWYLNQHHLISDIWGSSIIALLVSQAYAGEEFGPQSIPDYPVDRLSQDPASNETDYWNTKASTLPPQIPIYGETPRHTATTAPRIKCDIGKERTARLKALTAHKSLRSFTQDLTLFNIVATVYFAYINRISGQHEIAIGTPSHNRPSPIDKNTPGVFIEFFPISVGVENEDTFLTLYQRVFAESTSYLKHAEPGSSSAEAARQFNVILNFITAKFENICSVPTSAEWIHPDHCDPGHHMRLHVSDINDSGSLLLEWDLNRDVIGEHLSTQVATHFITVLDAFLDSIDTRISEIPLSSATILKGASNPDIGIDDICKQIHRAANATPNATAVSFNGETATYSDFLNDVASLREVLISKGIGDQTRVAVHMRRSYDLLKSILAVLECGAAFVPIASDQPASRVNRIIEDCDVSMVLTHQDMDCAYSDGFSVISVDAMSSGKTSSYSPPAPIDLSSPAYILYTSGSTGKPKGVVISHASLSNYISWAATHYLNNKARSVALFTSIGFDLTITSMFMPLICGGSIVVYGENRSGPDLSILRVLEENKVHLLKCTPSHLKIIRQVDLSNSIVESILVGGENFTVDVAKDTYEAFGGKVALYNEYGPTEATVGCIVHKYDPISDLNGDVPIGAPIDNMHAFILDSQLRPVTNGVTGELYLAGAGLSDGYFAAPEATSQSFLQDVFEEGEVMYRTGDYARLNQSGEIEFKGRQDDQIKVNGVRIEPGEIEHALISHPNIGECVVDFHAVQHRRTSPENIEFCAKCGLPSNYPQADFDHDNICSLCRSFEGYQNKVKSYFKKPDDLLSIFDELRQSHTGQYDCIMLYSGGKDSTYALGMLVEMGLKVLAFTLDNGYISDQAKANVRRIVKALNVDHIFGETEYMNEIFKDSLARHSNVCNGCFKTIYTLSTQIALDKNIPAIVTGLSRGQFFETRLTEELFWSDDIDPSKIDATILSARKAYHKVPDAVNQCLDVSMFEDESVFDKVRFIDFYRYTDVSLTELYAYLDDRLPWVRPTDTGRSTNCTINQLGIYVHKQEVGYNNYAFPYSWDVRIGHKKRDSALEEINEVIDEAAVKEIMQEIGYSGPSLHHQDPVLTVYYTGEGPVSTIELKAYLKERLPATMIPQSFVHIDHIPLTGNHKVDFESLRRLDRQDDLNREAIVAPQGQMEEIVHGIWCEVLQTKAVSTETSLLDLGGSSLAAIRIVSRINEQLDLEISVTSVFEYPTIQGLSVYLEEHILELLAQEETFDNEES